MLILDTDHFSEIDRKSPRGVQLLNRLANSNLKFGTTIITADEQLRGLLAHIGRQRDERRKIAWFDRLQWKINDLGTIRILSWNDAAVDVYERLRETRIRIGTMDLRIASIVLAHQGTLLSRNLKDCTRVPDLKVENWL